jgi:hypothetical protein
MRQNSYRAMKGDRRGAEDAEIRAIPLRSLRLCGSIPFVPRGDAWLIFTA